MRKHLALAVVAALAGITPIQKKPTYEMLTVNDNGQGLPKWRRTTVRYQGTVYMPAHDLPPGLEAYLVEINAEVINIDLGQFVKLDDMVAYITSLGLGQGQQLSEAIYKAWEGHDTSELTT